MPKRSDKPPRDPNQLAKWVVDQATGQVPKAKAKAGEEKNPHAAALGRLGGLKGGKARANKLSSKELSEIGKKGARARWGKS